MTKYCISIKCVLLSGLYFSMLNKSRLLFWIQPPYLFCSAFTVAASFTPERYASCHSRVHLKIINEWMMQSLQSACILTFRMIMWGMRVESAAVHRAAEEHQAGSGAGFPAAGRRWRLEAGDSVCRSGLSAFCSSTHIVTRVVTKCPCPQR